MKKINQEKTMKKKLLALLAAFACVLSGLQAMEGPVYLEPLPGEHGFDPVDPHDGRPDGDPFAEGGRDLADRPLDEMTPEERAAWQAQQEESGYGGSLPEEGQEGATGNVLQNPDGADPFLGDWVNVDPDELPPGQQGATVAPVENVQLPDRNPQANLEGYRGDLENNIATQTAQAGYTHKYDSQAAKEMYDTLDAAIGGLKEYLASDARTPEGELSARTSLREAKDLQRKLIQEKFPSELEKFERAKAKLQFAFADSNSNFDAAIVEFRSARAQLEAQAKEIYKKRNRFKSLFSNTENSDAVKEAWITDVVADLVQDMKDDFIGLAEAKIRALDAQYVGEARNQEYARKRTQAAARLGQIIAVRDGANAADQLANPFTGEYQRFLEKIKSTNSVPADYIWQKGDYIDALESLRNQYAQGEVLQQDFVKQQSQLVNKALKSFGATSVDFKDIASLASEPINAGDFSEEDWDEQEGPLSEYLLDKLNTNVSQSGITVGQQREALEALWSEVVDQDNWAAMWAEDDLGGERNLLQQVVVEVDRLSPLLTGDFADAQRARLAEIKDMAQAQIAEINAAVDREANAGQAQAQQQAPLVVTTEEPLDPDDLQAFADDVAGGLQSSPAGDTPRVTQALQGTKEQQLNKLLALARNGNITPEEHNALSTVASNFQVDNRLQQNLLSRLIRSL